MRWFRMYDELLDDPKVQRLPPELFKVWVNLLCLANRQKERGTLPHPDDIAFALRVNRDTLYPMLSALIDADLIKETDAGIWFHHWDERQYYSDTPEAAAERKRKQRDKEREGHSDTYIGSHSDNSVTVTPPDTDTDTEQIQRECDAPQAVATARTQPKPSRSSARETVIPDDWRPTDDMLSSARAKYSQTDVDAETERFILYHGAKGTKHRNWEKAWWYWLSNPVAKVPKSNGSALVAANGRASPAEPQQSKWEQRARAAAAEWIGDPNGSF